MLAFASPSFVSAKLDAISIVSPSAKVTFKCDITGSYAYIRIRKGSVILDGASTKQITNDDDTNAKNIEIKNASTVNGNIRVGYTKGASPDTLTITGSTVNVRKEPSTDSEVITALSLNSLVKGYVEKEHLAKAGAALHQLYVYAPTEWYNDLDELMEYMMAFKWNEARPIVQKFSRLISEELNKH